MNGGGSRGTKKITGIRKTDKGLEVYSSSGTGYSTLTVYYKSIGSGGIIKKVYNVDFVVKY